MASKRQRLCTTIESLLKDGKVNLIKILVDHVVENEKLIELLSTWEDNDIFKDIEISSTKDILAVAKRIELFFSRVDCLSAHELLLRIGLVLHFPPTQPGQKLDPNEPNRNIFTDGNTLPLNDTLHEIYRLIMTVIAEQYNIPLSLARIIAVHIVMQMNAIPIILPKDAASEETPDYKKARDGTKQVATRYIIDAATKGGITHLLWLGPYPWELYETNQDAFDASFTTLQKSARVHTSKICKGATHREVCELILTVSNILSDLRGDEVNYHMSKNIFEMARNHFHTYEVGFQHGGTDDFIYVGYYGKVLALRGSNCSHMKALIGPGGLNVTMSNVFPNEAGVENKSNFPNQQYLLDPKNVKRDIDGLRIELVHYKKFDYSLGFGIIDEKAVAEWKDHAADKPEERMADKVEENRGVEAAEFGRKSVGLLNSFLPPEEE